MQRISLNTTNSSLYQELKQQQFEGVRVSVFTTDSTPPEIGGVALKLIVSVSSQVALGLFVNWLYDRLKKKPAEKVTINGQQISGESVQIDQINQIIQINVSSSGCAKTESKPK